MVYHMNLLEVDYEAPALMMEPINPTVHSLEPPWLVVTRVVANSTKLCLCKLFSFIVRIFSFILNMTCKNAFWQISTLPIFLLKWESLTIRGSISSTSHVFNLIPRAGRKWKECESQYSQVQCLPQGSSLSRSTCNQDKIWKGSLKIRRCRSEDCSENWWISGNWETSKIGKGTTLSIQHYSFQSSIFICIILSFTYFFMAIQFNFWYYF